MLLPTALQQTIDKALIEVHKCTNRELAPEYLLEISAALGSLPDDVVTWDVPQKRRMLLVLLKIKTKFWR